MKWLRWVRAVAYALAAFFKEMRRGKKPDPPRDDGSGRHPADRL